MADDQGDNEPQRRSSRRTRNAAAAVGSPASTPAAQAAAASANEPSANQLFERLINAQADPNALKSSGFMWVPDDDNGFTVGEVKERNNDTVTVQLEDGRVCIFFGNSKTVFTLACRPRLSKSMKFTQ